MSDAPIIPPRNDNELRVMALIAYGLFLAALFNGITAIVGVVLAYVMRGNAQGTIWESHFRNLIRVFWITAVVLAVTIAIAVEGFGGMFYALATNHDPAPALAGLLFLLVPLLAIIGLVFMVWFLYRTVRGLIRALEDKPY
ncbi:MAG TPA: hypothetical protein VHZ78_01430 [Rhizomicrobium sp.]|jgi:uncharacterized membrane protein|nr:hypothetical protein [Rhizomicrobium sp.]